MFIQVRLLEGFSDPLFYAVPEIVKNITVNSLVRVPIKQKVVSAMVLEIHKSLPKNLPFKVRSIIDTEPLPKDLNHHRFVKIASKFHFIEPLHFYKRIRQFLKLKESPNNSSDVIQRAPLSKVTLTKQQAAVYEYLKPMMNQPSYSPTLLHGVTGSGKTEVYIKLILEALKNNKSTILLHPEVSLSMQFQELLTKKMPMGTPILSFHSATKISEKKNLWRRLVSGQPLLILGVHLPVMLPISNLGFIIVDEEHEVNFKEKKHPKFNSKELALLKANIYQIPILLGSATPSLSSLYSVKTRNWKFFQLKERFAGKFPIVQKVMLSQDKARPNFWISIPLKKAIEETISKKEQVLIFLNRRGFSSFLLCKLCSYVPECPNCSVSLTLHSLRHDKETLKCHYCSVTRDIPKSCPECSSEKFIKKGIGTQQVVAILEKMFPSAVIKRADLDSTTKKREWSDTVKLCEEGKVDILVGTQSITKGYHFPKVTLVGVLWADMGLHFPIFNASEITIQQLLQVSGRAGRENDKSKVIIQILHDHPVFKYLNEIDYLKFYKNELENRTITNYPPIARLMYIEIKNSNPMIADLEADKIYSTLESKNKNRNDSLTLLGPVKPIIYKIQKYEFRHIYIKAKNYSHAFKLLNDINTEGFKSSISIVPSN